MKKLALIIALSLPVSACTTVDFSSYVDRVNAEIKKRSPQLAKYCSTIQSAGAAIAALPKDQTSKAAASADAANAAFEAFCTKPPEDLGTAIAAAAAAATAAQKAYVATRAGN